MTHNGVLATILSGLEPAIAIALACLPLLRPLLGRKNSGKNASTYGYGSSTGSGLHSKKATRSGSRPFTELDEDHEDNPDSDGSSQIQLQPVKPPYEVKVSPRSGTTRSKSLASVNTQAILVKTSWEVTISSHSFTRHRGISFYVFQGSS